MKSSQFFIVFLLLIAVFAFAENFAQAAGPAYLEQPSIIFQNNGLTGDSRNSNKEWNEFFHSPQGLIKSESAYNITFKYKVISRDSNANFYTLLRSKNKQGQDFGQQEWATNDSGTITMPVFGYKASDYYLIIGIRHKGAIVIQDIKIATDPSNVAINIGFPTAKRNWQSPGHRRYYVDSVNGNDTASGAEEKGAWRSLDRINSGKFSAGDQIFLKAGSNWHGYFSPAGRGSAGEPIIVDQYGDGPKPRIDTDEMFSRLCLFDQLRISGVKQSRVDQCRSRAPTWIDRRAPRSQQLWSSPSSRIEKFICARHHRLHLKTWWRASNRCTFRW